MLKGFVVIGMSLVVAGCATVADVKTPEVTYVPKVVSTSPKCPEDVVRCVSSNWLKNTNSIASVVTKDGYILSLPDPHRGVDVMAWIEADGGTGSRLRYAERAGWLAPEWIKQSLVACQ
jgi:hypothetical protein